MIVIVLVILISNVIIYRPGKQMLQTHLSLQLENANLSCGPPGVSQELSAIMGMDGGVSSNLEEPVCRSVRINVIITISTNMLVKS